MNKSQSTRETGKYIVVKSRDEKMEDLLNEERAIQTANQLAYQFAQGIGQKDQGMHHVKMPMELRFYNYKETMH